jgi:hypothetical protein
MGVDWRGAALTCVSIPDGICSMVCRAEMGENRRLPRTTPAFGCTIVLLNRDTGAKTWRWVIPGSRLLSRFPVATRDKAKFRQVLSHA